MVAKGKRDRRIVFERATMARGSLGAKTAESWTAIGGRWAAVFYGSGAERRESGVEDATQAATFNVLADSLTTTITAKDRITFAGLVWDVTGIVRIGTREEEIEFTAVASRG